MRPIEIERSSTLAAPAERVWAQVTTMDGVNAELGPWIRMTHPPQLTDLRSVPDDVVGRVLLHSWLLAGGVIPFDRHSLRLEAVEETPTGGDGRPVGGRFVEESTSWMQRRWRHEREVVALDGGGCRVTDRLVVEPRVGIVTPLVARVVAWLFGRRHLRLVELYGRG